MTDEKKPKNTFLSAALEAKKNKAQFQQSANGKHVPKPSKGFGGATVVRRSGRGG